jgi:hypothetical protein
MKIKLSTTFIFFAALLISCTKTSPKFGRAVVSIRVENSTIEKFSNFTLNNTVFGGIPSGKTSRYFLCNNVLPIPFANAITINNIPPSYIVCIVPTPYLKEGKYRLKVVSDTLPYHYQATIIEE